MKPRTKTHSTIEEYTSRVVTLAKRVDCSHDDPMFPDALIQQLESEKAQISKSTWFKKKASLIYYFEQQGLLTHKEKLKNIGTQGLQDKSSKTSSMKKKNLTEKEEVMIRHSLKALCSKPHTWGRQLLAVTECILTTGLRPIELSNAELFLSANAFLSHGLLLENYSGGWPMLYVHNAKHTNGRSFDVVRHLDLSKLNKEQVLFIQIAVRYAKDRLGPNQKFKTYQSYYDALRMAFDRFINKIFTGRSKTISLYTYRHQCIADLKFDEAYNLQSIAAIVGHGNDLTATEHYGRKKFGRSRGEKVQANLIDVEKVKPLIDAKLANLSINRMQS